MNLRNTSDRAEVRKLYAWSMAQAQAGAAIKEENWDKKSPWHNTRFIERASGKQWVIYLEDQAWPGEVKILPMSLQVT